VWDGDGNAFVIYDGGGVVVQAVVEGGSTLYEDWEASADTLDAAYEPLEEGFGMAAASVFLWSREKICV